MHFALFGILHAMNEAAKMVWCVSVGGQRSICLIAMSGMVSCVNLIRIKSKEGGREIMQF